MHVAAGVHDDRERHLHVLGPRDRRGGQHRRLRPRRASFTVDTVAPDTTITGRSERADPNNAPPFTFSAEPRPRRSSAGSTAPAARPGPTGPARRRGTSARSPTGRTRSSSARRTWRPTLTRRRRRSTFTVDTAAPDTTITGGPTGVINQTARRSRSARSRARRSSASWIRRRVPGRMRRARRRRRTRRRRTATTRSRCGPRDAVGNTGRDRRRRGRSRSTRAAPTPTPAPTADSEPDADVSHADADADT